MKMKHIILNLLNVGLPNLATLDDRFIGKEHYMKKLQDTMNSNLGSLPEETTPKIISSYIKPLSTMNEVIDKFLNSCKTISVKYSLLMRLQLFSYNLKEMELPKDAKWSTLKNFI